MATSSIKVLLQLDFPTTPARLWIGSGPYVDADGEIWMGCTVLQGLDTVEQALNGEAYTLNISLTGVTPLIADLAWSEYQQGVVLGSRVRLMIQPCDEYDQPQGSPEVKFTGTADNILFDDVTDDEKHVSTVTLECGNRFILRRTSHGAVLSDTDQRARSAILNPAGNPDRFCERVPMLKDKTIVYPRWS